MFEQVLAQRSRGNVETQGLLMPLILTPIIGPAAVVPVLVAGAGFALLLALLALDAVRLPAARLPVPAQDVTKIQ